MARDTELLSLSSFGEDLIASGAFSSLQSLDVFSTATVRNEKRSNLVTTPDVSPPATPAPRFLPLSGWTTMSRSLSAAPPEIPASPANELIIGGAVVQNVALVVGESVSSDPAPEHKDHDLYSDVKVMPVPVSGVQRGGGSLLVASIGKTAAQPMLLLPAENDAEIAFPETATPVALPEVKKEMAAAKGEVGAAAVDSYVLSGDIKDFFGIKGLKAKLYSFRSEDGKKKDDEKKTKAGEKDGAENEAKKEARPDKKPPVGSKDAESKPKKEKMEDPQSKDKKDGQAKDKGDKKDEPIQEKVKLKDMDSPLGILFPEIEQSTIQKLPLKNLEFTYSNKEKDSLFPVGLRLEGDLEFQDGLQFVSDGLKNVFGSDKGTTLPSKLRVSALIAKERDWSKKPKIEGLVLQAYADMTLPKWDFLEFKTVGIELSARKEEKKKDDKKEGGKRKKGEKGDEGDKSEQTKQQGNDKDKNKKGKVQDAQPEEGESASSEVAAVVNVLEDDSSPRNPEEVPESKETEPKALDEKDKSSEDKGKKDKEKEWKLGVGLFGKLNITKLPKSKGTLEARYWIRGGDWKQKEKEEKDSKGNKKDEKKDDKKDEKKDGKDTDKKTDQTVKEKEDKKDDKAAEGKGKADKPDSEHTDKKDEKAVKSKEEKDEQGGGSKYELVINVGKWDNFCGVANLSMKKAELRAFFKPGDFRKTCTLTVSGSLEFPQGSLEKEEKEDKKKEKANAETAEKDIEKHAKVASNTKPKPSAAGGGQDKEKESKGEDKKNGGDKKGDADKEKPKNATLEIKGQLSRKDYHFDAKVGNLKLESILKIYAHIHGVEPKTEGIKDHNLTFEELHLNIGRRLKKKEADEKEKEKEKKEKEKRDEEKDEKEGDEDKEKKTLKDGEKAPTEEKDSANEKIAGEPSVNDEAKEGDSVAVTETKAATKADEKSAARKEEGEEDTQWCFELSGKVSFNDVKSVHGLIKYDSTGLTIEGGVEDYKVKDADITIKEARIDIFIGAKPKTDKKLSVHGKKGSSIDADAGGSESAVVKSSQEDSSMGKDLVKKDTGKDKEVLLNRASKFSIRGKVTFSGVTVTVAFLTQRKETNKKSKQASEREWMIYGLADTDLCLAELCDTLAGTPIGNLRLRNVAVIAASGEIKSVKELNTLKYPVRKGISLCATIPPLDELNILAKEKVDGLVLCATIQRKLELKICLPSSMDIHISQTVKLGDIGVGIEISTNPSLSLDGVLTILMESGQDPLVLEGMVRAGALHASAYVATKQPWVNPFNISKEVTIADFRVEILIEYAKFLEVGPSKMGLGGQLEVGDFEAGAAMVISHFPDDQLISVNISEVDLIKIVQVAGKVANIPELETITGAEELFVFTDAKLYVSTGATIGKKEYPRGISGGGKLTAFGKKAEFELSIGAAGLDFKGAIDNFSLGPLVVSSASGEPRASMVVLMTKEQQIVKVDGMVTCFGIGLVTLVDIQLGTETPSFNAYIAVQFTKAFTISLQATAADFSSVRDLAHQGLYFQAEIQGDLFDMICESIKNMIKTIEKLGTDGIESVQNLIGAKIGEKQAEMDQLAKELEDARIRLKATRSQRQVEIEKEEKKRKEAEKKIARLRQNLATAKKNKSEVEAELKQKVKRAELDKEALIQRKRKEYNDKLEAAKEEEARNRKELERLEKEQANRYGLDFLKRAELAKGAWYEKMAAEKASWAQVEAVYWEKCKANWLTIAYWAAALEAEKARHELVKAATAVYHETAKGFDATINSDAFQGLVTGIEKAAEAAENAAKGIDNLIKGGGFDGFVRAFVDTEDRKIQAAINNLHAMQSENSKYQQAIRDAQAILDKKGPNLEAEIRAADETITRIQEDAKLAKLQREYDYRLKVHEEVHNAIKQMDAGLEALKKDWQNGMQKLQDFVNEIQKKISSVFHIEKIVVGVHTHALVNNEPLVFKFYGTVANRRFEVEAEWSPKIAIGDLYKKVTNEILKIC
ncbi:uncharacterized protein BO95DRAFT_480685 [Aspergillus brunneoviolaceus CBS 621.78]|uniref:Uncharacterized protein n=1 Tax=Aspergillus brunneoviolaceus CBS 621.78 TaxID=1450534 RepID=A0ACD1GEP5_9EURO|nr:hypothetical protein BO95DRAFT_480685 [Aspergillus brunneoviolaceus CBS 621.78]RAH47728.1 hypothetical protein BO95DRAFT_480685 [Aspergillus brunneoviolaceus CBS 621.78]